jgi:AAHS family benzoate transporter-like MFS transporter
MKQGEDQDLDRIQARRRTRTVAWVVAICATALAFDGYDLVVYGTVVSTLIRDPEQLGRIGPEQAGALGSYALIGVMVGAFIAGSIGDIVGRRRLMLINLLWFSVGMGVTAMVNSVALFGVGRFLTGIGVGALVATAGAIVAEFAPPGKKNLCNAIVYSGVPLGGVLAALLAILLLPQIGWRGLFWVGALPLVTLLPLAMVKLPESIAWLTSRGRDEEARRWSARTGIPVPATVPADRPAASRPPRAGFVGLFRDYPTATLLLGFISASCLLLVYALGTWLPYLMRLRGFGPSSSLMFLLVLNAGAVLGALGASRAADRFGPKPVVASSFLIGALTIASLTMKVPTAVLLIMVAIAGLGTSGTQVLLFGFVANYYRTTVRAAGVAWAAGFGRLGGIGGPLIGGLLIGAGIAVQTNFYFLAAIALIGLLLTMLVPASHRRHFESTATVPAQRTSTSVTDPVSERRAAP